MRDSIPRLEMDEEIVAEIQVPEAERLLPQAIVGQQDVHRGEFVGAGGKEVVFAGEGGVASADAVFQHGQQQQHALRVVVVAAVEAQCLVDDFLAAGKDEGGRGDHCGDFIFAFTEQAAEAVFESVEGKSAAEREGIRRDRKRRRRRRRRRRGRRREAREKAQGAEELR